MVEDAKPETFTVDVAEVVFIHVDAPDARYWTLYEVAPETSDQSNVADDEVMFVAVKPEATEHGGAAVVNVADGE